MRSPAKPEAEEEQLSLDRRGSVESPAPVPQSAEHDLIDLDLTDDETDPELESEWEASIELGGVYHRRRYPEYITRIGYIPEN